MIVVGTISGSAVVVVLVSMYLYRKRQQRYFAFSSKKAFGSFIDLKEVISFGNDTMYWENINYTLCKFLSPLTLPPSSLSTFSPWPRQ